MYTLKTVAVLFVTLPLLIAASVQGKRTSRSSRSQSWSISGGDYWFWAYTFSDINWPKTPMSMTDFGNDAVETMWENKPDKAQAAVCIQGPWSVKNYNQVGGVMRISYFKKGFYPFSHNKVRNWDCTYIWGPDNQFYSYDDVKNDRMAWRFNETFCSVDTTTMDLTCR